jgi:hypothetical protein
MGHFRRFVRVPKCTAVPQQPEVLSALRHFGVAPIPDLPPDFENIRLVGLSSPLSQCRRLKKRPVPRAIREARRRARIAKTRQTGQVTSETDAYLGNVG